MPDATSKAVVAQEAIGMAETEFHGTHVKTGNVVRACGPEVVELADGKIRELRDYHRLTPA